MHRLRAAWAALFLVIVLGAAPAPGAERVALVIGNGAYRHAPALADPPHDAQALAAALTSVGFEVSRGEDLDRAGMEGLLGDFTRRAEGSKVALFFYAGYGVQVEGRNYLVPVDAELRDASDLGQETLRLDSIIDRLNDASRANIVILDACRDNPLGRSFATQSGGARSGAGLAAYLPPGAGTLIAYCAAPGQVVPDGDGTAGSFARSLAKHIVTPGLELRQMLTRVRAEVAGLTRNRQVPWDNSSLLGDVYLAGSPIAPSVAGIAAAPRTERDRTPASFAQRATLYIEDPSNQYGLQHVGKVTWRSVPAKLNAQFDTGVEAEIDVPAVGFRLVFTLRRNNDRSLPASHVIEVQFTTAKDFNGGSVANVPGILMKRAEQSRGSPLAGLAVKVSTDYFLIGLSDVQADREKNIELLRSHGWIDLPIVFSNQRRAIVAIEKGTPGERFFADALAQWGNSAPGRF